MPNYRYTWRAGGAPSRAESMAAASYELEQGGGRAWSRRYGGAPRSQLTRIGAALAYRYL